MLPSMLIREGVLMHINIQLKIKSYLLNFTFKKDHKRQ